MMLLEDCPSLLGIINTGNPASITALMVRTLLRRNDSAEAMPFQHHSYNGSAPSFEDKSTSPEFGFVLHSLLVVWE